MNINTIHTTNGLIGANPVIQRALQSKGIMNNHLRVVTVGSVVMILPDTDVTKSATQSEIFKAMGYSPQEPSKRTKFLVTDSCGDRVGIWALTDEQVRLLEELEENGYLLYDDAKFETFDKVEATEI